MTVTRSPGLQPSTSRPTARTVPDISWPSTAGNDTRRSMAPCTMCRSVPQIPVYATSIWTVACAELVGLDIQHRQASLSHVTGRSHLPLDSPADETSHERVIRLANRAALGGDPQDGGGAGAVRAAEAATPGKGRLHGGKRDQVGVNSGDPHGRQSSYE